MLISYVHGALGHLVYIFVTSSQICIFKNHHLNVGLIWSKLKISAAGTAVVGGTEWYFFLFCFFCEETVPRS